MAEYRVFLDFPDTKTREQFLGWFLDGGGEGSFFDDVHERLGEDSKKSLLSRPFTESCGYEIVPGIGYRWFDEED